MRSSRILSGTSNGFQRPSSRCLSTKSDKKNVRPTARSSLSRERPSKRRGRKDKRPGRPKKLNAKRRENSSRNSGRSNSFRSLRNTPIRLRSTSASTLSTSAPRIGSSQTLGKRSSQSKTARLRGKESLRRTSKLVKSRWRSQNKSAKPRTSLWLTPLNSRARKVRRKKKEFHPFLMKMIPACNSTLS